jgi:nitroimidazol reductase NimA-like FMN-containing flavoprotein (pyridoxamine 5'-phosphate oxidase superfamily)
MNDAESQALLNRGRIGRLGCVVKDEPYVLPLNYMFEDACIYSHSLPGRKIDSLRINRRACLQVDEISDDLHWRSVIAFGVFEEIVDVTERADTLRKLLARFPLLTPVESRLVQDAAPPEFVVFRIRIDRITGVAED